MDIPISLEIYQQLLSASCASGFEKAYWEIGATAINEWTARHNPDSLRLPSTREYQWKQVFPPNGTILRTVFQGKNHHCLVEDDQLRYNGQETSPSRFANAVGGVRRNAWKVTWILFPGTTTWKLAATLRGKRSSSRQFKSPT